MLKQTFHTKYLPKILPILEKLSLTLLLVGAVMQATGSGGMIIVALALSTLACVYFLEAFMLLEITEPEENESSDFKALLGQSILPRVLGVSMSVAIVGIQFYLLQLEGYATMLLVGGQTIVVSLFLALVLHFSGTPHLETLRPKAIKALIVVGMIAVIWWQGGLFPPR